jgi:hypothetical protein
MVMPFGKKELPERGIIDFNLVWDEALAPLLRHLGYAAVRADEDLGPSIIEEMLIRLTASDLVVADLTMANANVYYEVGVRHGGRKRGCVLIAAEWATVPFDLGQIRHKCYPLPWPTPAEGLSGHQIAAIREALRPHLEKGGATRSPVFDLVPGFPGDLPTDAGGRFREFVGHVMQFQERAAAVRAAPASEQPERVEQLVADSLSGPPISQAIALELLDLVRDHLGFQRELALIVGLPPELAPVPQMVEREALALAKLDRVPDAIAKLKRVIADSGQTPERLGMLGGRYKQLALPDDLEAQPLPQLSNAQQQNLSLAIESYTAGMWLDLNEYYCSCNLPRLLRLRGDEGDEALALQAATITAAACERARSIGDPGGWLNATLLGAAFDSGDADLVEKFTRIVLREGASAWQLKSTLRDLTISIQLQPTANSRDRLTTALATLTELVNEIAPGSVEG